MIIDRRVVLGGFGVASAAALLSTLGCGAQPPTPRRPPQVSDEVRGWLRDAVARLTAVNAAAGAAVHALAVSRRRTRYALDVLGTGIARQRLDGAVLSVVHPSGARREHATSDLSARGLDAAVTALGGGTARAAIDFGAAAARSDEPPRLDDGDLRGRLERLLHDDARGTSRIVYAAALIEIDDAIVWSIAPRRDLEQRRVRIRQSATRAAWNGTRPVVREVERAWSGGLGGGGLGDLALTASDLATATEAALQITTPGRFDDGARTVVLDPSCAAMLVELVARHALVAGNARHPSAARRAAIGEVLASTLVTIVDDPTAAGAYGGFAFDDEGEPAAPIALIDAGRVVGSLADRAAAASAGSAGRGRRLGHTGPLAPAPSHLQLVSAASDAGDAAALHRDGFILEGALGASYEPGTDQLRLVCARARELRAGNATGRIYPEVELASSLTAVLASIDGIAREPIAFPSRAPGALAAPWCSISAPAIRTRGVVRPHRGRA